MTAQPQPRRPVPPASSKRAHELGMALRDAVNGAGCSWNESVCTLGFVLAVALDGCKDDAMRIAVAENIAQRLVAAAWNPGSYGIAEKLQ